QTQLLPELRGGRFVLAGALLHGVREFHVATCQAAAQNHAPGLCTSGKFVAGLYKAIQMVVCLQEVPCAVGFACRLPVPCRTSLYGPRRTARASEQHQRQAQYHAEETIFLPFDHFLCCLLPQDSYHKSRQDASECRPRPLPKRPTG